MPESHSSIRLADYRQPDYLIDSVHLSFELADQETWVASRLNIRPNYETRRGVRPLKLDGRDLPLEGILINGRVPAADEYRHDAVSLTIFTPPVDLVLELKTRLNPAANTRLEGLYRSGAMLCTQCEAEGFRCITWFLDRPDVLARYEVTISGDPARYPVMLANGNLVEQGEMADGRRFVRWQDPFPKPSYLFALVAGDLVEVSDSFTTASGRQVALQFFVEAHNRDKCGHALASLQKAMAWDESRYGLEYDLDQYMVVAADDFNMGAMENKGLNVFNSKYVLASPATATDVDYENIEAVIAHEYFHNWTGNRVTCRDWFQLSLKEGLTVFRDQEFTADMTSAPVKRINDVMALRARQFPEDGGPLAHPVRPATYIEINNFYTVTVYEKGAELVRMLQTLIGAPAFAKGLHRYLTRYDGQAATVEDFVRAMAEAGGRDLSQFLRWYSQAGTPVLQVSALHDPITDTLVIAMRQSCPDTPGQKGKEPFHIPVVVGLLDRQGRELPLHPICGARGSGSGLLELRKEAEIFRFRGIREPPVVSLLRGFSAPVHLDFEQTDAALQLLLAHDSDPFNRWEAGQLLAVRVIRGLRADYRRGRELRVGSDFVEVFRAILAERTQIEAAYLCQLLTMPAEDYLAELEPVIEVAAIHAAREAVRLALATALEGELRLALAENNDLGPYRYDPTLAGRRQLKNLCLAYLMRLGKPEDEELAFRQFAAADNMTDEISGLRLLVHAGSVRGQEALAIFAEKWGHDPLVMDKWLGVQATAPLPSTLAEVERLMGHPAFRLNNPNRARALLASFANGNPLCFHDDSGTGYRFMAARIQELDLINPQIAARLAGCFNRWRRFPAQNQALMQAELERIKNTAGLSRDLFEVVSKSLA
ncbi:MAG: aminopeptidase N [Desulfobulbaceae bacterium]|nr:aminopeptidase N [Desulfobulbaceae bacterium]